VIIKKIGVGDFEDEFYIDFKAQLKQTKTTIL
jgi:hypothetical protein